MTVRPILIYGAPQLRAPGQEVVEFDASLAQLVADLFETNAAAHGAGLAANQIGDPRRVFVFDCPDERGRRFRGYVVNPIISTSEIPQTMPDPYMDTEGCLSVPGEHYPTGRANEARVLGVDMTGNPVEINGEDYFARCLQHESDHLEGRLYIDRLIGRNARAAKRMLRAYKNDVRVRSWMPGKDPDPFR